MDLEETVMYWAKSSDEDMITAQCLFDAERYPHSLFFCHLTMEKILKGLIVRSSGSQAPFGHGLIKLAKHTGITWTEEQQNFLAEVTAFNIEARYNDFKLQFYNKATREYAREYLFKTKEFYAWLRKMI